MNNKLEVIGIDHGWSMMKTMSSLPQWDLKALSDYHKEADDGKKT